MEVLGVKARLWRQQARPAINDVDTCYRAFKRPAKLFDIESPAIHRLTTSYLRRKAGHALEEARDPKREAQKDYAQWASVADAVAKRALSCDLNDAHVLIDA